MKFKKLLLAGVSLGLIAGLAACGSSSSSDKDSTKSSGGKTKISFTWWGAEVRHNKYIKAIKAFEKANPDIEVDYEYAAFDDYWKKLATKSAAGELPDVIQMDASYVAQYGKKNQLADLSSYIGKGKTIDSTNIDKSIINGAKLNGKNYGVAPAINAMSMITNSAITKQAGINIDYSKYTFDDWTKALEQIKDKTGKFGMIDVVDNFVLLQYYLRTQGEELFKYDKNGKPQLAFTKKNYVHFMDAIAKLAKDKAIPTSEVASNVKSFDENPFSLGQVAYYQNWNNQYVTYSESAAKGVSYDLNTPYGSDTGALSYRPTFYYSVAQTSKHKKAAAKLVDFMVNSEEANKICGTERGIPANTKAKKAIYDQMTAQEKTASDYLDKIKDKVGDPSPVLPVGFAELNTAFKDDFAEMTYGTKDGAASYTDFKAKTKEIFDENYD